MDTEPFEPVRTDPRITVEAAPAEADGVRGRSPRAGRTTPARCPHRIRVRDLRAGPKAMFTLTAVLVFAALAVATVVLIAAAALGVIGARGDTAAVVVAAILAAIGVQVSSGAVACLRAWRRLHKPGLPDCVLTTIAAGVLPLLVGITAAAIGQPWLAALIAPPLAVMTALWYLRSATLARGTCAQYPWPPPRFQPLLKPRPPAAGGGPYLA